MFIAELAGNSTQRIRRALPRNLCVATLRGSRMQVFVLFEQVFLGLWPVMVLNNAICRAHQLALRFILGADALGALGRIDHVDFIALRDGAVRALRFANVAVDAFIADNQRHGVSLQSIN